MFSTVVVFSVYPLGSFLSKVKSRVFLGGCISLLFTICFCFVFILIIIFLFVGSIFNLNKILLWIVKDIDIEIQKGKCKNEYLE